jgi:hypothetical protein
LSDISSVNKYKGNLEGYGDALNKFKRRNGELEELIEKMKIEMENYR